MSDSKPVRLVGRVDHLPSGRHRFRTEIGGRTQSQTFDTAGEARAYQLEVSRELATIETKPRHRRTLAEYGVKWFLARRADREVRDVDGEEKRWAHHIGETKLGRSELASITPAAVKAWFRGECARPIHYPHGHPRNGQPVSRSTIKKALVILRLCLDEAVEDSLLPLNPARAFRSKRSKNARTHEPWTYLEMHEQDALLDGPEDELHDLLTFAMCTAVRQGEQWNLELADVRSDHVVIRYGSAGGATKTGKLRTVPLFGRAEAAVERQVARLAGRPNPHGLLWPTSTGARRQRGKLPDGFKERLADAGIIPDRRHDRRHVRWYDLRHTGASSLVAGWWGRAWSLQEVRDLLGHSTITMTERYAHLAPSALQAAVRATPGPTTSQRRHGAESADVRPISNWPFNPSVQGSSPCRPTRKNKVPGFLYEEDDDGVVAAALAERVVKAIAADSECAPDLARELAEVVLQVAHVKLALDILDGDPKWGTKALLLAEKILGVSVPGARRRTS